MSVKKRLIPTLVASTLAIGASLSVTAANAVQFTGVYVFGDSLSDAGYFRPFFR